MSVLETDMGSGNAAIAEGVGAAATIEINWPTATRRRQVKSHSHAFARLVHPDHKNMSPKAPKGPEGSRGGASCGGSIARGEERGRRGRIDLRGRPSVGERPREAGRGRAMVNQGKT